MRSDRKLVLFLALGVAAGSWTGGCSKKEAVAAETAAPAPAAKPTEAGGGKIPVTTASAEAKAEFLQGRDNFEKLLVTDSIAHFEKAVSLDPNFAWAELAWANAAPTGKEFFDHLHKAVALADKASNGEKLMILATEAGANANPTKQKEYLDSLIAAYPNDERAHFNLGGYYFGQQEFDKAAAEYRRATEIEPNYSTAYNLLGYSLRQAGDYASAEKAFQKYIELIPKDPNPYDSYAELLLKMGRFDDSIAQYRKALEIQPNFINAHQGIAMALLYSGKPAEAEKELDNIAKKARTDGERRTGLLALTVVHVDDGKMAAALADVDRQYALGEKTGDIPAMAGSCALKGNILLEMGKPDQAKAEFEKGVKLVQASSMSQQFKDNAVLASHNSLGRVALAKKDFATAKSEAETFRKGAEAAKNPAQLKTAHSLDGQIAMAEKNYDKAIEELRQANAQNAQDLYRLCQAYQAKGDTAKAAEFCGKAAGFNSLPAIPYAFVRAKAKKAATASGAV